MMEQQAETSGAKRVVVVAVDNSEHSEKAIDFYLTNVQKEGDFAVLAFCPEWYDLTDASPAEADRLVADLKNKVDTVEKKYLGILKEKHAHLKGKFRTQHGKPGEVICRVAEEEGAAIIICGSRGQGKIRRTILGSVSDYIIHHSSVPVLVCRH